MKTWRLPAQIRSASAARRIVREALQDAADRPSATLTDEAALLVSELVTNAVLHGSSDVTLAVELSGHLLRVEVADRSPEHPVVRSGSPVALGGRGVALVDAYASRWGVESRDPEGKTVWFELMDAPG